MTVRNPMEVYRNSKGELVIPDPLLETIHQKAKSSGLTWNEVSKEFDLLKYGVHGEALRKRVGRYLNRVRNSALVMKMPLPQEVDYSERIAEYLEENIAESNPNLVILNLKEQLEYYRSLVQQSGLEDSSNTSDPMYQEYPDELDDSDRWAEYKENLAQTTDFATVLIFSDIHFPDHNPIALKLAIKIAEHVQPDIIVFNGDIFDFDALSTFAGDRRRRHKDALLEVEELWHELIDELVAVCPKAFLLAFKGNHDDRMDRWNNMNANPFSDTTERSFVEMVRSDGRVAWLAETQETELGRLIIQHGKKAGENAPLAALKDRGFSRPQVQGHTHRPAQIWHRGVGKTIEDYIIIQSVVVGTLCNIPAHYIRDTKQSAWLNGVGLAHVGIGFKQDDVNIQNIVFHKNGKGLSAFVGKEILVSN